MKHKKNKKKEKKEWDRSSESDLSDENSKCLKASTSNSEKKMKKKKKHKKKYDSSDDSDSSDEMEWVEVSCDRNTKAKKKKKKRKKEKRYSDSSNSSESSTNEDSKTEMPLSSYSNEKRESWMNEELFVHTLSKDEMYTSSRQKKIDSKKQKQEEEEKIYRKRELNPHLKNERQGLPEAESNVENLSLPSTSVGDGGYSWLKKAYYRIQEQAQLEGRSMEEVAVERWGSLSKLTSLIEEAEARMKSHPDFKKSKKVSYDKYNQDSRYNRSHFKKPHLSSESEKYFDSSFRFKKPSTDSRSHKRLNEFKSSRKSNYSNESYEWTRYDDSDKLKNIHKEKLELTDVQSSTYSNHKSDDENRIPAWKKPKFLPEKTDDPEISTNSKHKSDDENRIPAWKKTKYLPEKTDNSEISTNTKHKSNSENRIPAWKKTKSLPERTDDSKISSISKPVSVEKKLDDEIPVIYSDDDLSKLASKQIKAEIMGDTQLAEKLKKQLEEAREIVKERGFAKQSSKKVEEEVILTKVDSQGLARPIQMPQDKIESYKQKKVNKNFFDDGSRHSLKQMFEREKLTTADDHMEMFVEASAQSNETAEIDYESGHISKKLSKKLSATCEEERDIGKAIQQHQKLTTSIEKCQYCMDSPKSKKYLIFDVGEHVYLSLPNFQSLTDGHCLIVPKAHVSSFLSLDENEWKEVNDFKNQLRNLFRADNKSVLFLETSMNYRYFPHAIVECIPVPKEDSDVAPFYFKKAIQESETEWAHNKKLIDLSKKGLRYSVPKGLPYFHIEFDPAVHAGYAHVIEEEKYFPRNFGKEVIGGMIDIDYNYLYKNRKEDPLRKSKEVAAFEKKWTNFKNVG